IRYTFPATNVAPGRYVVVAENPTFLFTKFAAAGALGPYTNTLSKYGEKITLRNAAGDVEDEVEYRIRFPLPTIRHPPGYSTDLLHPPLANNPGGSWRSSTNAGAHGPTPGRVNSVFASNAPPQVRQVEHQPEQPRAGDTVTITAKVTDPDGVAAVTLQY